jgi:hypothetical protein
MNQEQEITAWSLAIAVLVRGAYSTDSAAMAIEHYKPLADGIAAYIRASGPPLGNDSRFK